MKTIWKFPLSLTSDRTTITLPAGSEPLCVQAQPDAGARAGLGGKIGPMLWALCDPSQPRVEATVTCYGTGFELPDNPGRYVSTVQHGGGALVLHYFVEGL